MLADVSDEPSSRWSPVTLLGFVALIAKPFQASYNFGILVSAALLMGIFGDLILMQSVVLTSPFVRQLIRKVVDRGNNQSPVTRDKVQEGTAQ